MTFYTHTVNQFNFASINFHDFAVVDDFAATYFREFSYFYEFGKFVPIFLPQLVSVCHGVHVHIVHPEIT